MKRIVIILILCFVFSNAQAQMDNPLKDGMPNTVKLPSGEVIYDLTGEWEAIYDTGGWGTLNDTVKITQNDNQFVGIYLIKGDWLVGKNKEKIKGKIKGNLIDEIFMNSAKDIETADLYWAPSKAEISKDGNEILIKRSYEEKGSETIETLTLRRR